MVVQREVLCPLCFRYLHDHNGKGCYKFIKKTIVLQTFCRWYHHETKEGCTRRNFPDGLCSSWLNWDSIICYADIQENRHNKSMWRICFLDHFEHLTMKSQVRQNAHRFNFTDFTYLSVLKVQSLPYHLSIPHPLKLNQVLLCCQVRQSW